MSIVLDASALLALLHDEPGADQVNQRLDGACVSTVNWSEVLQKSLRRQVDVAGMYGAFSDAGLSFEPFTTSQAELAARLWGTTRKSGLSLADRACLALAAERRLPILTADRIWTELGLDLDIRLLR